MEYRVLLDPEVFESMEDDDMARLQSSVESLISNGIIQCDNHEIYINAITLQTIIVGTAILKSAYIVYGQETNTGYVTYPFEAK